jgi:ABC-type lipoprotein export system ATPase subunit
MNSLFTNDSDSQHKCVRRAESCICELLDNWANNFNNLCSMGNQHRVSIVLNGASEPLSIFGKEPTEFILVRFDRRTGCAVFSFEECRGQTRTLILNCDCICGVLCVGDKGPYKA